MEIYKNQSGQRGATIVETMLSVVLVALVTFTAINRYGATLSALFGRGLVVALGGKAEGMTAGVPNTNTSPVNPGAIPVAADPLPLIGGSSAVGGVPNMQPARIR